MALETGTSINDLVSTNPVASDQVSEGDDHLRLIKSVLKTSFNNPSGNVHRVVGKSATYTATQADAFTNFLFSSTGPLHLPAAATAGNGCTYLVNSQVSGLNIIPNGTQTINSQTATFSLNATELAFVRSNGSTGWQLDRLARVGRSGDLFAPGILQAQGGQIQFPATQVPSADANCLDDYEEGTWTPVATFATPGDLSVAYTTRIGTYTKVGRKIHFVCNIETSTFTWTTASGAFRVTGLPFTTANDACAYLALGNGVTTTNAGTLAGLVQSTLFQLINTVTTASTFAIMAAGTNFTSGTNIRLVIAGQYEV